MRGFVRILLSVMCGLLWMPIAGTSLAQGSDGPVFETAPCIFAAPEGFVEGENLTCGTITVPERHAEPDGAAIRLALAIFHAPGETAPDPILFITGGPGGQSLELYPLEFNLTFAPLLAAGRDIIFYDQRGVGTSEPALECPGFAEVYLDTFDYVVGGETLTTEEILQVKLDAMAACAADLRAVADLAAYNTTENAADVPDMLAALGEAFPYESFNLWGSSYGAWVALEAMRNHPDVIRSVILDAPVTPEADLYLETPASYARALDTLFTRCAEDAACDAAYPDLEAMYYVAVEKLNAEPVLTDVIHPMTGARYDVLMTGDMFAETIFRALYLTPIIPALPQVIDNAQDGVFDLLLYIVRQDVMRQDWRSWGMYFSVLCQDEYPFNAKADFDAAAAPYPAFAGMFTDFEVGGLSYQGCPLWDVPVADSVVDTPVSSDLPVLIINGELDPIVPPHYGSLAAENLPNGREYLFPGVGHGGSSGGDCPMQLMISFIQDPTGALDDACVAEMTVAPFLVPAEVDVTLVPFASEVLGIQGVRPDGWEESAPGSFVRGATALDNTALVMQPLPIPFDQIPAFLQQQFSLDALPEITGERAANDLNWLFYALTVQGVALDFAVAETAQGTLLTVLQVPAVERDPLFEDVFLPVVDALKPME